MASTPEYTYKPPAPSFLFANVLNPLYDRIVVFYPRWWTPNGITIFGIASTLTASVLLLSTLSRVTNKAANGTPITTTFGAFDSLDALFPSAAAHASAKERHQFIDKTVEPWILILAGVLNLVYCIADNTDGKQARRWKMSSPIGEYLDHGLDCVTSLLSTACLVACAGLSLHAAACAVLIVAFITNMSHTLNLRRGIFIWGTEWASVDEAMIAFGVVPILAGVWPAFTTATLDIVGYPQIRVVDVGLAAFLFSQVTMAYTICQHRWRLWIDPLVVVQGLLVASFGYAAYSHKGGTVAAVAAQARQVRSHGAWTSVAAQLPSWFPDVDEMFVSYPAVWFIAAACCASMVVHVPIAAKCVMKTAGSKAPQLVLWPLFAAFACLAIFTAKPWLGAVLSVLFHNAQMLSNIRRIVVTKREVDAKAAVAASSSSPQ